LLRASGARVLPTEFHPRAAGDELQRRGRHWRGFRAHRGGTRGDRSKHGATSSSRSSPVFQALLSPACRASRTSSSARLSPGRITARAAAIMASSPTRSSCASICRRARAARPAGSGSRPPAGGARAPGNPAFEKLVEALGVPRDVSRNPLFQIAFAVRRAGLLMTAAPWCPTHRVDAGIGNANSTSP